MKTAQYILMIFITLLTTSCASIDANRLNINKNIDFNEADGNFIGMMKCSKNIVMISSKQSKNLL